jgi:hypothetical protein
MGFDRRPKPTRPLIEHELQGGELLGDDLNTGVRHRTLRNVRITRINEHSWKLRRS